MSRSSNVVRLRMPNKAAPNIENGKVRPPSRKTNKEVRSREYLTPDEVDRLMVAAKSLGRHAHRDATLILIAYRHGRVGVGRLTLGYGGPQARTTACRQAKEWRRVRSSVKRAGIKSIEEAATRVFQRIPVCDRKERTTDNVNG